MCRDTWTKMKKVIGAAFVTELDYWKVLIVIVVMAGFFFSRFLGEGVSVVWVQSPYRYVVEWKGGGT